MKKGHINGFGSQLWPNSKFGKKLTIIPTDTKSKLCPSLLHAGERSRCLFPWRHWESKISSCVVTAFRLKTGLTSHYHMFWSGKVTCVDWCCLCNAIVISHLLAFYITWKESLLFQHALLYSPCETVGLELISTSALISNATISWASNRHIHHGQAPMAWIVMTLTLILRQQWCTCVLSSLVFYHLTISDLFNRHTVQIPLKKTYSEILV